MRYYPVILLLFGCSKPKESDPEAKTARIVNIAITVKDYGVIEAELYPDIAPKTVDQFLDNIDKGIYTDNRFHRIMDGFMIQGGADYTGTVKNLEGEFASNQFENNLKHTEGVLSMARARDKNSATSQFFIMVGDAEWLDGEYAAFGKVTKDLEIVKKIASDARPVDNNGTIPEEEMPVIEIQR